MGTHIVQCELRISANRQDTLKVHTAEQQENSLLLILLAKLMSIDFTEELACIICFVSYVCSGMGHTTVALHPQRLDLGAGLLPWLVIPLCSVFRDRLIGKGKQRKSLWSGIFLFWRWIFRIPAPLFRFFLLVFFLISVPVKHCSALE